MNAKPFTRFAFSFLRVLLTAILLLGLVPVVQPAPLAAPLAAVAAEFAASPTNGVAPLTVNFTNTTTGGYTSSLWDFGDGGTSKKEHPSYRYKRAGVYTVSLTVSGPDGTSTVTKPAYITVCASAYADFEAAPLSGLAPLVVTFGDRSCGAFSSWSWDFGDGSPDGSAPNPTHTYGAGGTYSVTLTASGDGTQTKTKTDLITVYDPVQADFAAQPTSGVAPLSVAFTNTSTGDYTTSLWDFGDGSPTSSEANPTHTYTAGGAYTVSLTASGPGGTDTETKTGYVTVYEPVQAEFTATPTSGDAPLSVQFSDASSGDYDSLTWDLGDGSPTSAETNPVHTYSTAGVYTVTLTAEGPGGTDTMTKPGYVTAYSPVDAEFAATPTGGIAPLTVAFTDLSSGEYTTLSWDLGDGSPISSEANPTHTYSTGGVYTVTLTASGPYGGDSEVKVDYITVYTPVQAGFSATPASGPAPLVVTFANTSTGDYDALSWDFGDGSPTSSDSSPVHTYTAAGIYTPTLTISGPGGTDEATATIEVYTPVQAAFVAEPISGTVPLAVTFTNTSSGDYTRCEWDFGDTFTSTLESPVHTYSAAGVYTVTLTVEGPGGTDSASDQVSVYEPVVAGFDAGPARGVVPLAVTFTNTSTGDYTDSLWDFGDTITSTIESPLHSYEEPGLYTVSLTVSGPGGSDTEVITDCVAVYPLIPDPGPWQTGVVLQNLGARGAAARLLAGEAGPSAVPIIPPRAAWTIPAAELAPGAPGAWAGAGVLRASEPVAAVAPMTWDYPLGPRTAAVYAGLDAPATAAYLPWLAAGDGHLSQLVVQNAADTQAWVAVHLYDLAGALKFIYSAALAAQASETISLAELQPDFSTTGGRGVAIVSAEQAVAVVGAVHAHEASEAYAAWTAGATILLAPGAVRRLNPSGDDWSELAVQNPGEAAAEVQVEFIAADGTLNHALADTIPAHGGAAYSTRELAALGEEWQGTVRVTSSGGQPLAGVSISSLPSAGVADNLAYNAAAATAQPLAFPDVHRQLADGDGEVWSLVLVHNATAAAGTLCVEFYDAWGQVGGTYSVAVPARGLARLSLRDGLDLPQAALEALGTGFTGSLWVTPSAGLEIAGVAETLWPGAGRAAGYAGFAAP